MYKVKGITKKDFVVKANTEDFSYLLDKDKFFGTTPVGYVVVGMTSCALMCVRGYYIKQKLANIYVEADVVYDGKFVLNIKVDKKLVEGEKEEIVEYIKKYCTVSKMLATEIEYNIEGK